MTGGDPLQLTHLTILLPERAMLALRDAFLRAAPGDVRPERPCCCRASGRSAISIRTN
jgi:hypothetical protein